MLCSQCDSPCVRHRQPYFGVRLHGDDGTPNISCPLIGQRPGSRSPREGAILEVARPTEKQRKSASVYAAKGIIQSSIATAVANCNGLESRLAGVTFHCSP